MTGNLKILLTATACIDLASTRAQDVIMFRDGREKEVKVIQVNNDKTLYTEQKGKDAEELAVDNKNIYMLKYEKRGNVFFNAGGERIFGSSVAAKVPKGTILVYYKQGREDYAYDLSMDENVVTYTTGSKKTPQKVFAPKSDVFLIKYPDGTKDILVDLAMPASPSAAMSAQTTQAPTATDSTFTIGQETEKASKFPREAVITTKSKKRMKVIVCEDTDTQVAYKKDDNPNANIFKMAKKNIKEIKYKD